MKAEIGKTYRVQATDCCVNVHFTARLISVIYDADDVKLEYPEYAFHNGVIIHGIQVELIEVQG